jgi:hypothetical protein
MSFLSKIASQYDVKLVEGAITLTDLVQGNANYRVFAESDQIFFRYYDASNNIGKYNKLQNEVQDLSGSYYSGTDNYFDPKSGLPNKKPSLADARQQDTYFMASQQNNMLMLGLLTTATLLITSIILARR